LRSHRALAREPRLPETTESDQGKARQILVWRKAAPGKVGERLEPEAIEAAAERLRDEKYALGEPARTPAHVNRCIGTLPRVATYALRPLRCLPANPFRAVRRFKTPEGVVRFPTPAEAETSLAAVDARK